MIKRTRRILGKQYHLLGLVILVIASVAFVGGNFIQQTHAAANNSFYLSPASGTYTVGSTITVVVHEYSTDPNMITAMEADFSYTSNLAYQSEDFSTSPFKYQPPTGNGASGGIVSVQNSGPGLSGDQIVGTVTFSVTAPGTATLAFKNTSQLINGNGTNILATTTGASYTLNAASSGGGGGSTGGSSGGGTSGAAPAPAPVTTNSKGSSISVTPKSGSGSGSSSNAGGATPVTVPDNGSVATTTPVSVEPATIQPDGVKKVEYYLGGKLVDTETKAPYKYNIDTTKLKNGTYKLVSKTYYTNGMTKQATQHLIVKNTATHTNLTWLYLLIAGIILLLGLGVNFIGTSSGGLSGPLHHWRNWTGHHAAVSAGGTGAGPAAATIPTNIPITSPTPVSSTEEQPLTQPPETAAGPPTATVTVPEDTPAVRENFLGRRPDTPTPGSVVSPKQ